MYEINLIEGEGVGTAYEYYTKLRKLKRFINSIDRPKKVLIAGLPEKYGLSMDFFLIGQSLNADTVVVDERDTILERARKALDIIKSGGRFNNRVRFMKTDNLARFGEALNVGVFDLALSSEVLQRLDGEREVYISNLTRIAKNIAIFVPNRGNESHADLSGLNSIYLEELLKYFREGHSGTTVFNYGYIDMPPFPPGLSRSDEKRQKASESRIESFLMKGLEFYSLFEDIFPVFIKKKAAHIVFVMVKNRLSLNYTNDIN